MKLKGKKIVIGMAIVMFIGFIGIKATGFQFAGPSEFAILRLER